MGVSVIASYSTSTNDALELAKTLNMILLGYLKKPLIYLKENRIY